MLVQRTAEAPTLQNALPGPLALEEDEPDLQAYDENSDTLPPEPEYEYAEEGMLPAWQWASLPLPVPLEAIQDVTHDFLLRF